jgi:hypothetical protein
MEEVVRMAWEDRTPEQKAEARRAARRYRATDNDLFYIVVTAKGSRLRCQGINSARALAGKDGTYQEEAQ